MTSDRPPQSDPSPGRFPRFDAGWLLALALGAAAWCLTASPRVGPTYDELRYLEVGLKDWQTHTLKRSTSEGIMPLPPKLVTAPLYAHERNTGDKLEAEEQTIAWLGRARAVTLGWLLLLIVSAWRLGRAAGGEWAGRIAAGLVAADPTVLGHATLATTDVAVTAALVALARAVYAGRGGGWWARVVLPGLWYGVAALCKLSALLYGGIILLAFEAGYRLASGTLAPAPAGEWLRRVLGAEARSALAVGAVVLIGAAVAVAYCGRPEPGARQPPLTFVSQLVPPHEPLHEKYKQLADKYKDARVPYAVGAFAFQWWRDSVGRPTYVCGTYYPASYRFYFPLMVAMKTPLAVYLLAALVLLRPRAALNPPAFAALLMLGALMTAHLQIGVRLAMPAVAMGYVAVAVGLARGYPLRAKWFGGAAVVAMAATSAWVWPHGLCYINQASGGLAAGPRRMTDSNLDWGQGVPDLAAWREANGRPEVVIWYFGSDPAARREPFRVIAVEALPVATAEDFRRAVGPRVLAVGYSVVTLQPDAPPAKAVALGYLATRRPLARTATFVLYDFRDPAGPPPLD